MKFMLENDFKDDRQWDENNPEFFEENGDEAEGRSGEAMNGSAQKRSPVRFDHEENSSQNEKGVQNISSADYSGN